MIDLTSRQIQVLRAVINEFIESAEAVGSETIDKKYGIGVSPATIRNEMVALTDKGYLRKAHSSAGRFPTPQALKLYVHELMKEKELSVADEVSAKEKIWQSRDDVDGMLAEIAHVLADRSHAVAISMVDDKRLFSAGYANLLSMPEFYDINVTRHVFQLIEEVRLLSEIFHRNQSDNQIQVLYGAELGNHDLDPIALIYTSFDLNGIECQVGVVGSSRFDYSYVIPTVKLVRRLAEELAE